MSSIAGKVAIVTGASSGIGAATAVQFAKLGALLAITGRNVENLEKTAKQCQEEITTARREIFQNSYAIAGFNCLACLLKVSILGPLSSGIRSMAVRNH